MKKILSFLAVVVAATATIQAATVGWSIGKTDATYKGNAYQFFIIGQNGVTTADAIAAILSEGGDVSSYVYGKGTLTTANGGVTVNPNAANGTLDAGTYTGFFVIYDSAAPAIGSKFIVLDTANNLTKTINAQSATISFQGQDQSSAVSTGTWQTYGTPEPTTVALLALGLAAVGLKRKVA